MSLGTLGRRSRVILAIVAGWTAIGVGYELFLDQQKRSLVGQLIPPIAFENTPASVAIERILNLAKEPIDVRICQDLSNKAVTLQTNQPERLDELLVEIGRQIVAHVQMYEPLHRRYAAPTLSCERLHRGLLTDRHQTRITAGRVPK
jgi:hypothetical protein